MPSLPKFPSIAFRALIAAGRQQQRRSSVAMVVGLPAIPIISIALSYFLHLASLLSVHNHGCLLRLVPSSSSSPPPPSVQTKKTNRCPPSIFLPAMAQPPRQELQLRR